ncbi:MAG: TIM-barrel domain-containing protein [Candidatus Dormibacteria bacterium]
MSATSTWTPPQLCRLPDAEPDAFAPRAEPRALTGARAIGGTPLTTRRVLDDVWLLEATGAGPLDLVLPLDAGHHVAGGGEQFGELDLAGRVLEGWCFDGAGRFSYLHAPVFHCSAGWTLIVDTVSRYTADVGASEASGFRFRVPDGRLRAFLVDGPPRRGLEMLLQLTGTAPAPPAWAFGVWHNVRGGAASVLEEARRLQAERVPVSALWIEDHYDPETNDGDGWPGNYEPGEYPENTALVRDIHSLGLRALTYVNPMLYRDTPACDDAMARGLVVRRDDGSPYWQRFFHPLHGRRGMVDFEEDIAVPLDFTNPAAVSWWQEKVSRLLTERDWDGFMEDFGEQVPADARLACGARGEDVHNLYPLLYHGATAATREACKPDSVVFARSGWLGSQRYANVHWGGDQLCSWDPATGMPAVIPAGLSAALSGIGVWGLDISGIVTPDGVPLEESAGDRELWLRWCQLGALTPVMRTHLGFKPEPTPPVDVWHDGELTDAFRRDATFHLRLFPYLYSLAMESCSGGLPVMRPLLLEYPDDPQTWTVQDQFLLGDALLVAPVLERGARSRSLYLPRGRWYQWSTGDVHEGPAWITVDAPLDRIPLFQREGTVLPLLADTAPLSLCDDRFERGDYDLELHVTPDGESRRLLHDGTTLELRDGDLEVAGRHRTVLVRCMGEPAGLAHGERLTFDLRVMQRLAQVRRHGGVGGPARSAIDSERLAESRRRLHHDEMVEPEPVRPGVAAVLTVRESPEVALESLILRWRSDGGDPLVEEGIQQIPMQRRARSLARARGVDAAAPAMTGESVVTATPDEGGSGRLWSASIPPQEEGVRVRYAFAGRNAGGEVWVEDAGPPLEAPDVDVAFVRPPERRFSYAVTSRRVPAWLQEAVIYHVLVDRFHPGGHGTLPADADVRFLQHAGGTLRGLLEHLDHISELGADTLLLSPITPGEMHVPYDATDLCDVDPRLGTVADARALLSEAHSRGMRVLLDTEMSMLGYRHPHAVEARRDPRSPYRDWFRWHEWPHRPYSWFGGRMLVTLDHGNPGVRSALIGAARWWLDLGFDGFRLDSAAMAPFDFWTEFGAAVRDANPDAVTLGEVFGSVESLGHWRGRLDGVFDYTVAHRLRSCYGAREQTPRDVAAAMLTMSQLHPHDLISPVFLETHDVSRFTHIAGEDSRARLRQALAVMLTLGPTPVLYYGTEVGRRQGPASDIDPDARLPMPWGDAQDRELFDEVRALLSLRRESAALRRGAHIPLQGDDTVLAFLREDPGSGQTFVVAANSGTADAELDLSVDALIATPHLGTRNAVVGGGRLRARIVAGETAVWEVSRVRA